MSISRRFHSDFSPFATVGGTVPLCPSCNLRALRGKTNATLSFPLRVLCVFAVNSTPRSHLESFILSLVSRIFVLYPFSSSLPMNNFRFTKVIASVSPILAKETVLSKIINMVDAFTITLSHGFDDNNKKYVDTLMKLDNSKTIILETRGKEIRIKNTVEIPVKKGQKITIDYSEYTQDSDQKIYIDYAHLDKLPVGANITFEQSQVIAEIIGKKEDYAECKIIEANNKTVLQYDRVTLQHNEDEESTLNDQDKKDILRGLEYGTHIVALSACHNANHIKDCKTFLKDHHNPTMKVFAKIETQS